MKLHTKMLGFFAMFFMLTFSLAGCGDTSGGSGGGGVSKETYKFDDGTLQGWTADGLWHVTDVRYSSSPNSVWYSDGVDYDTGAANSGSLTSPLIYLGKSPSLDFDYFLWNECETDGAACVWDNLFVEVSTDSGATWAQLENLPEAHAFTSHTIDLSAYAYSVVRIRFFFDTLDDNLNAFEGAYVDNVVITDCEPAVALFANTSYVDYSPGNSDSEASNLETTLNLMARSVTTFTGITAADFQAAVKGKDILAIPELENGDLDADLDAAARTAIADFVSKGGTLMIHADFAIPANYINLLNSTFGFSLEDINTAGPYDLNTTDAFGTIFADGPSTLPENNATGSVLTSSLPVGVGAKVIYDDQTTGDSALTVIPYGDGSIVIFGWDWDEAAPTGSSDGGWLEVLYRAMFTNYYLQTDATDRGYWDEAGDHLSAIEVTVVGFNTATHYMYNSYFIFDLSGITGDKTGASLRLELQYYDSGDPSETFSVYHVSTDSTTLDADGTGQTAIFNDLQTGEVYGAFEVTSGDVGTIIEIPLSAEAVSDINNAAGGTFAVGIHLNTYSGGIVTEAVRFSNAAPGTYQLVLTSY